MSDSKQEQLILTDEKLNTSFAEAYRTLRANISFSSVDQAIKTILVTSAGPREGKSTTVLNLGIILAQAGGHVLLVDGDLRRPSLHRQLLGISPNGRGAVAGLSDVIVGQCKLDQAIKQTAFANLSILPAGAIPPNPNELLASQRMRTLVDEMSPRADFILFDSPPCLLFTDAFLLAQITNGVLFVLRAGTQDKAAQRRVQKQLQQAKARVLGVVFNDVEVDDSASSSYYYETDAKRRR